MEAGIEVVEESCRSGYADGEGDFGCRCGRLSAFSFTPPIEALPSSRPSSFPFHFDNKKVDWRGSLLRKLQNWKGTHESCLPKCTKRACSSLSVSGRRREVRNPYTIHPKPSHSAPRVDDTLVGRVAVQQ